MIFVASLDESLSDKLDGYRFIHSKVDLDRLVVENSVFNKVLIRNDFATKFFTPTSLETYIENVKILNSNVSFTLDFNYDETTTKSDILDKIGECISVEEIIDLATHKGEEFLSIIKDLISTRDEDRIRMLAYSNQVSQLQNTVADLRVELDNKEVILQDEIDAKKDAQNKFDLLISRVNYQYNKGIDKTKLFSVDKNSYDKIIYIKEITRVQYTDTFIRSLKEILSTMYNMPARLLVIESYFADGKVRLYSDLKPHNSLIERDVIGGDILMLGMQSRLMEDILKNTTKTSILIVLDRGGFEVPHIYGDNVEYLFQYSDIKDKPDTVPSMRCITYDDSTLSIPYIEDYDDMNITDRISKYSSMPITKAIVEMIERR
jgi:hypothetical protein